MASRVVRKKVESARHAEREQAAAPAAPEAHSAEALEVEELKLARDATRHRKMIRKSSAWQAKDAMKDPMVYWECVLRSNWRDEEVRHVRPHMTMHFKGGWQLKLEDGAAGEDEEGGWVEEVVEKAERKEVELAELLKTAKRKKARRKEGEFEIVKGGAHSVIVLEDETIPEPSIEEPWEFIDSEEEENSRVMSYAEVASSFGT